MVHSGSGYFAWQARSSYFRTARASHIRSFRRHESIRGTQPQINSLFNNPHSQISQRPISSYGGPERTPTKSPRSREPFNTRYHHAAPISVQTPRITNLNTSSQPSALPRKPPRQTTPLQTRRSLSREQPGIPSPLLHLGRESFPVHFTLRLSHNPNNAKPAGCPPALPATRRGVTNLDRRHMYQSIRH